MTDQIVITLDDGSKAYIGKQELGQAKDLMVKAGYDHASAIDKALDLAVGICVAQNLSTSDFLFNRTGYVSELMLLATVNSKTQYLNKSKQIQDE
jgi:hypothetical protein